MLLYMYASVFILYGAIDHKLISLVLSLMSEYHCGLYLLATHQVPLLWIGQLACIYDFIIKQKKKRLQLCFFLLIVCLPIMILGAVDQRPTNPSSKAKVIDWDKLQAQIEEEVIHQPSSFIFFRFCVLQISWKNRKKKRELPLISRTYIVCIFSLWSPLFNQAVDLWWSVEIQEKEEELKDDATTDADTQRTMNKKTCEPHLSPYP